MELLQLRYFRDCAQNGSIAKTAEKYMVPASSVSASIRRLEQELDTKLFDRGANRIILNAQGERFLKTLEKTLSELDAAVTDMKYPSDKVKIRLLVRSKRSKITDAIIEYRNLHPNITFELNINFDEADHGEYDIIVSAPEPHFSGYRSFLFSDSQVGIQARVGHPLSGKDITLKQLKGQPFVTMGGNLEQILVSACEEAGFTPNIVARVNDISCYAKIVRSGLAIGHARILPGAAATDCELLNVTDLNARQQTYVYYKDDPGGEIIRNFIEFLMAKRN